jgi:formylglycine-generating enzyme
MIRNRIKGRAHLRGGVIRIFLLILTFAILTAADPPPASADQASKPVWASVMGKDLYGTWADLVVKGVTQRFRLIPAGTFTMGCDDAETDAVWNEVKDKPTLTAHYRASFEAPQHAVTLTLGFWCADSSCTQALWQAVMGSNPSHFTGDPQRPVETVTWDDCKGFCTHVNGLLPSAQARLPSEAEWEYACRAGTTGWYNGASLDALAWYTGNSGNTTHPVKRKSPNAWGLYDMHGNVCQWCADWYRGYPSGAVTDPAGPVHGEDRVVRGSSWSGVPLGCRSAARFGNGPGLRGFSGLGFRFCLSVFQGQQP